MKNSIAILRAAVAATVLTLGAGAASAATLTFTEDLSSVFTTNNFGMGDPGVGIRSVSLGGADSVFAFCIDPLTGLDSNNNYSAGAASVTDGTKKLYESSYASVIAGYKANPSDLSGVAGFQLALWELQNDDGDLSNGGLSFKGGLQNQAEVVAAQGFLTAAARYQLNTSSFNYTALTSAGAGTESQMLLTVTAVPEADTWAMLAAGLGLMGVVARRRKSA
ncbi:PEP-CTERM sorting domain-containing protein [Duganella sp. P38]|uniref:PEP-CTERM sorting domain-containing protein n=1 Tax=Duganella sp. P38 TaxID=3423949 RepID=UPI003D7BFAAB